MADEILTREANVTTVQEEDRTFIRALTFISKKSLRFRSGGLLADKG